VHAQDPPPPFPSPTPAPALPLPAAPAGAGDAGGWAAGDGLLPAAAAATVHAREAAGALPAWTGEAGVCVTELVRPFTAMLSTIREELLCTQEARQQRQ
jgi:hypothetical protein